MSKQISAKELALIVTKLLTAESGEIDSFEGYEAFMTEIAKLVCDHCGGEIRNPATPLEDVWYVGIHGNDSLPSAFGGIWREYDVEGELFEDQRERIREELAQTADRAYEAYDFGPDVTVTDHTGWEYVNNGEVRSRKVYVETDREDDGPAPRCVLNFTVKMHAATGDLLEACALDGHGNQWGMHPKFNPKPNVMDLMKPMAVVGANLHGHTPRIAVVVNDYEIVEPEKSECGRFNVDPLATYGLSKEQADCLNGLNALLEQSAEHAINEGVMKIREALGVPDDADEAGHFFTGDNLENLERVFRDYLLMEIQLGNAKAKNLNSFLT